MSLLRYREIVRYDDLHRPYRHDIGCLKVVALGHLGRYIISEDIDVITRHTEGMDPDQLHSVQHKIQLLFDARDMSLPHVATRVAFSPSAEAGSVWTIQTDGRWVTTSVGDISELKDNPERYMICDNVIDAMEMLSDLIALTQL